MVKSKLERAKSLVEKKVQALDDLETLISEVDKKDLNQFFSTIENMNTLFNAFQSLQKAESKEHAKIRSKIDPKRNDAKKNSPAKKKKKSQMR